MSLSLILRCRILLAVTAAVALGPGASRAPGQGPPLHRTGRVTLGDAVLEPGMTAGSAVVRLRSPSRIDWESLRVGAGESLRIQSETGSLASLHVVRGGGVAQLDGRVVADGPFYLVSPGGVSLAATGSVQAPRVFMSALAAADEVALLNGGATTFSKSGSGLVDIQGTVEATGGLLAVLGTNVSVGPTASVRAPGGHLQLLTSEQQAVAGSGTGGLAGLPPGPRPTGSRANLTTTGHLAARRIDLISEGFVRNGGKLETGGPGNRVLLSAAATTHEVRPRNASIIITDDLVVDGPFRNEGPVISTRDGANPSPVGGQRQTPRLSEPGFITQSDNRTTQLSFSPLQTLATASPIPPPSSASSVASRSAQESETPRRRQSVRRSPVRKASFFGQTVRK